MDKKELMEYAVLGLSSKIAEHEAVVFKGQNLISEINRNQPVKTTKSRAEILEVITEKQNMIKALQKKREELLWDIACYDDYIEELKLIKLALRHSVEHHNNKIGNLTLKDMHKLLDKIELQPYCDRLDKRYEDLTEEDFAEIADMQMNDYISRGESGYDE